MIYLDHAASTPMRPEAVAAMLPYLSEHPGNPSGSHAASRAAKNALEQARDDVARCVGCTPHDVIFTGGGSESDNLAVKGAARAQRSEHAGRNRVVTTGIEHKAVLASVQRLAREGFDTRVVPATSAGTVDLDALSAQLGPETAVVSVMAVNNESGIVQPLDAVRALLDELAPQAVLHTDAVQAPQWLDLSAITAVCDLVSLSGHKFGGPKGVGVLARRNAVPIVPIIEGGGHELGLRAGTQNVAGIVALAAALVETDRRRGDEIERIAGLRDTLERELCATIEGVSTNGDPRQRVAGLLHVAIDGIEAETLLVALDAVGVCAASGSACSSGAIDPSHVLVAMGVPLARALSSVRCSFGWASTDADVAGAVVAMRDVVRSLRDGIAA